MGLKDRGRRTWWRHVDGKGNREFVGRANAEFGADFFHCAAKEVSDMLNHLFARPGFLALGRAVRRGRRDHIRGVASTTSGRRRTRGDVDGIEGGSGFGHIVDVVKGCE